MGYVEEVGEGVTKVKVGHLTPEGQVYAVPDTIPDETAAQYILNPWTTYAILKDIGIGEGEYLLQTAAGSVLGRMVIQLAKYWGIKTINVLRRDDVKQELKELGADEVINSDTENVVARVKEITWGDMADGAIDAVAGILTKTVASSVKTGGRVLVYGPFGGTDESVIGLAYLGRVNVQFWNLFYCITTPERTQQVAEAVMELLESTVITPFTGKTFKLEEFKQAIEEAEKHARRGKVLLDS